MDPRKSGETEKSAKKVLTERNKAMDLKSGDNPLSEIAKFDPSFCQVDSGSRGNSMSQTRLLSSRVSDFDGDEKNSVAAYDPLTNYLSPRPKFLRYKPSRRREIFFRQQNDGAAEILVSPTPSSEEETGKGKMEDIEGECCEIDEEIEDEGEGDGTVKGLLKFLLTIAGLVLSTLYITSMNTPTPSFEVSRIFRSGFCPILNHTDEFGGSNLVIETLSAKGSNLWDEEVTEATSNMNPEGVGQFIHQEDAKNVGFLEETEMLNGENEYGNLEKVEDPEQVEEVVEKSQAGPGGTMADEMTEGEENEVEFSELIVEDDGNQEKGKENDESIQASKPSILNGFDQDNLLSDILVAVGNEYTPKQEEVFEMEEVGDWEMVESNKGEAESSVREASKSTIWERTANVISSFVEDLEKLKSELVELMHTETESVLKVILGLSVSSAILTCLVLSFQFKKKKVDKKVPTISASVTPSLLQSPVVEAEKIITREPPSPSRSPSTIKPTCVVDKSNHEHIGNVDSFKMLSSSIHSRDEVESSKELYHHEAPTVQFLGEIVVGGMSNSLKNRSGLKNRMIEAEDSSFHASVEQKPVSKNMNSGPEEALSEFSTTSSPSYGSTITKKKAVKKEVSINSKLSFSGL